MALHTPYEIYSKDHHFNHDLGNYIFVRKTPAQYEAVYIGEGFLDDRTRDPIHFECAEERGFTHFHVRYNDDEDARKAEEQDMIAGNQECLAENGGITEKKVTFHGELIFNRSLNVIMI